MVCSSQLSLVVKVTAVGYMFPYLCDGNLDQLYPMFTLSNVVASKTIYMGSGLCGMIEGDPIYNTPLPVSLHCPVGDLCASLNI